MRKPVYCSENKMAMEQYQTSYKDFFATARSKAAETMPPIGQFDLSIDQWKCLFARISSLSSDQYFIPDQIDLN